MFIITFEFCLKLRRPSSVSAWLIPSASASRIKVQQLFALGDTTLFKGPASNFVGWPDRLAFEIGPERCPILRRGGSTNVGINREAGKAGQLGASEAPKIDPRNTELWNRAADAYGTAEVFRKRARRYRKQITAVNFIGIAIPLTIGAIALSNLLDRSQFERAIYSAGILVGVQGLIFLWSIVANWPDSLDYSAAASAENLELSNRMAALAPQLVQISPAPGLDAAYAALIAKDDDQTRQDFRRDIREREKMYGYRAGRFRFQRPCRCCKQIPVSMKMSLRLWKRCTACGGPITYETPKQSDKKPDATCHSE